MPINWSTYLLFCLCHLAGFMECFENVVCKIFTQSHCVNSVLSCLCYNWFTFNLQYINFQFSSFPIVLLKILLQEELFLLCPASINKRVSKQKRNVCQLILGMWYIYIYFFNDSYTLQKLKERESDSFVAAQGGSQTLWLDQCDPDQKGACSWEFLLQGHLRLHWNTRRREFLWMGKNFNCCLQSSTSVCFLETAKNLREGNQGW